MDWRAWMDVVAIVGLILTATGTIIAICQARKASKSATVAEKAKSEVYKVKKIIEMSELISKAKNIEQFLQSRSSSTSTKCKGRNTQNEYKKIQDFLSNLNEQSARLDNPLKSDLERAFNQITLDVEDYNETNDKLYSTANRILASVRSVINKCSSTIISDTFNK